MRYSSTSSGFPAEVADLMDKARPTLEWTRTDTGCTVTTINGDKRHTVTFIFDKEVESELAGKKFKVRRTNCYFSNKNAISFLIIASVKFPQNVVISICLHHFSF